MFRDCVRVEAIAIRQKALREKTLKTDQKV